MYTTTEASQLLNLSIRVLQIELKRLNVKKVKNRYIITDKVIEALKRTETNKTNETKTNKSETIEQTFSEQEYERLEKIIKEYPILQERLKNYQDQIEYLKQLVESQTFQLHKILGLMEQRNYIEVKDKNKEPL